jgi:pimeloyl-ACP methyl ester carboxylesterase
VGPESEEFDRGDGSTQASRSAAPAVADEVPVYLPAGSERVFGILTRPSGAANGTAVLCLHDAQNLTSYRNRVYTRLCRDVAGVGYTAFRIDFHGTGDSSGMLVDRGVSGQTMLDVEVAVRWLTEQGAERVAVVAPCWGSLVGLVAAARHEAIASLCLIAPPLGLLETGASVTVVRSRHQRLSHALSHALRPHVLRLLLTEKEYRTWIWRRVRRRASHSLAARFGGPRSIRPADDHASVSAESVITPLAKRRVPIHALFGERDPLYLDLLKQGAVPWLDVAREILDIQVTPVTVHGLTTVEAQELAIQFVKDCLVRDAETASPTGSCGAGADLLLHD